MSGSGRRSAAEAETETEGYDIMGLTRQQVVDDVLNRYENHIQYLSYAAEVGGPSVLTPSVLAARTAAETD